MTHDEFIAAFRKERTAIMRAIVAEAAKAPQEPEGDVLSDGIAELCIMCAEMQAVGTPCAQQAWHDTVRMGARMLRWRYRVDGTAAMMARLGMGAEA